MNTTIGKLAPLAYASSFTIESFYNGTHYSYLVSINEGMPSYLKLGETETNEHNGLRVSYVVKAEDINEFQHEARFLYQFFEVKPSINIEIKEKPEALVEGSNWQVSKDDRDSYVVMGNVPYLIRRGNELKELPSGIILFAEIGDVSITPGRESLTYDNKTIDFITSKREEIIASIQANYDFELSQTTTPIEATLVSDRYVSAFRQNLITVPPRPYYVCRWNSTYFTPTFTNAVLCELSGNGTKQKHQIFPSHLNNKVVVLDLPSNVMYYVDELNYSNSTTIFIKPTSWSKIAIESMKQTIETELKNYGFTDITYLSEASKDITIQKTASTKLKSHLFQSKKLRSNGDTYKNCTLDANQDEVDYTYIIQEDLTSEIAHGIIAYRDNIASLHNFIVAPKKVKKLLESNPRFTEITSYLKETIEAMPPIKLRYGFSSYDSTLLYTENFPKEIRQMILAIEEHNKDAKDIPEWRLKLIRTIADIKTIPTPYTVEDITAIWPNFFRFQSLHEDLLLELYRLKKENDAYKDQINRLSCNSDE